MKIYIQTDLEGIAGFCFFENRRDAGIENIRHRHRMCQLLTNEVNAAVRAAFDSGAKEVIVNDSHGSGYNILFEQLDPRCRIIHGRNCSGPHWLPLLDSSFDAVIMVGMHAMGGTPAAITPHSRWQVNGGDIYMSECSMAAAIAGDYGVPAVFVSGDDKTVAEVSAKISGIKAVVVKEALSPYQACSMIPAQACQMIYENVKEAVVGYDRIEPYKIQGPVELVLLDSPDHCPPLRKIGEPVTADNISEAFMLYEKAMPWNKFNTVDVDGFIFP